MQVWWNGDEPKPSRWQRFRRELRYRVSEWAEKIERVLLGGM